MFRFSVVESSFCFANVKFIAVPAYSFIPLRSLQAIFIWKKGVDAACVLECDLEIDERVEIVYAGFLRIQFLLFRQSQDHIPKHTPHQLLFYWVAVWQSSWKMGRFLRFFFIFIFFHVGKSLACHSPAKWCLCA